MTALGSVDSAARQSTNIAVTRLAQDQQKLQGRAAVELIETADEVQRTAARQAGAASPPQPAPDGTGRHVDVRV